MSEYVERVVQIKRVSKVVKGGKRLKLYACVVAGDGVGKVGVGHAKAAEVAMAIKKATEIAKKHLVSVAVKDGAIPYEVVGRFCASRVVLKPASVGTGVVACSAVRAVCDAAGIKNILTKSLGSTNPTNLARATIAGLASMQLVEAVAEMRSKNINYLIGRRKVEEVKSETGQESDRPDEPA
jgi:small subunit ribosomal protein S5